MPACRGIGGGWRGAFTLVLFLRALVVAGHRLKFKGSAVFGLDRHSSRPACGERAAHIHEHNVVTTGLEFQGGTGLNGELVHLLHLGAAI